MEQRINFMEKGQKAIKALYSIGGYLAKSSLPQSLLDLAAFRVSQINGCAFCLDMHAKDLRAHDESEQRLYTLNAWRETPFFSDKERAALAWAEAITACDVPDEVFAVAREQFSEEELIDLTIAVSGTNLWNRINIAFHPEVGTYQPGQFK